MKRFLLESSLFGILAVVILYLVIKGLCLTESRMVHVDPDVHIAFLGNSHIEAGVNDSLIEHSINWGRASELPEFVYAKTRMLKRCNPQIDTVIIGFDIILGFRPGFMEFSSTLSHPFFYGEYDTHDWLAILQGSDYCYWSNFLLYPLSWEKLKDLPQMIRPGRTLREFKSLGGYVPITHDKLQEVLQKETPYPQGGRQMAPCAEYFFRRTLDFCRDNGIKVIFICPPEYRQSFSHDKISHKLEHQRLFPEVPFYDDIDKVMPDSCFADVTHLNYKGARLYSEYLNQMLNNR